MHTAKLCLVAAILLPACGGDGTASIGVGPSGGTSGGATSASTASPDGTIEAAFDHLQNKRVSSFIKLMAPPAELTKMQEGWAEMRKKPIEDAEDAQFQQMMSMLTADGAEDKLFAMVQPKLAEAQQQIGTLAGMAPMMAAGAIQKTGAPEDTLAMVESIGQKIAKMDIASADNAKKAIAIVCKAAREINIPNGAAMQKLSFDQGLAKADIAYGAIVDALAVYDLDFTSTFESVDATVVSTEGDVAEIEVSVSLFGFAPQTVPVTMERKDGRWFPRKEETDETPSDTTGMAR